MKNKQLKTQNVGGVLFYIKETVQFEKLKFDQQFTKNSYESIWVLLDGLSDHLPLFLIDFLEGRSMIKIF